MTQRSKSTLFLIEQLIVIAVFAICAAACVSIMTAAFFFTNDSASTSNAIIKAESAAEVFKASEGDIAAVVDVMGGVSGGVLGRSGDVYASIFYDSSWEVSSESNASYKLSINATGTPHTSLDYTLMVGFINVERITGEELVSLQVAARMQGEGEVMQSE